MTKQYPLPLPHTEAMAADDFMITASNREAAAWVDKWPGWPSHGLIVHGPEGSGKTHLLHVWLERNHGKLLTHKELTAHDAGTLTMANRIIAIDDAEKIAGKRAQEEALFHLYNVLRDIKGSLLLASAKPPTQWGLQLADLRSRLLSLPASAIAAPDDALLSALLIKQFHDRQIDISMDVVDYLLPRITRTPDALRKLVNDLDQASLSEGRGITVSLARKIISPTN